MTHRCYVGAGSNLGDSRAHITQAFEQICGRPDIRLCRSSSLYASSPMGPQDQPDYLNSVIEFYTAIEPLDLLDLLQAIESDHQRLRERRWGARTLDLDLLLYGDEQINNARLTVPHPGITERSFVLIPLLELDPDLHLPGLGLARGFRQSVADYDLKKIH